MGKKGKKDVKKPKLKSITPPESHPGSAELRLRKENEETSLGLTLGALRHVAKSPFNTIVNPGDTIMIWTKDNVEFFVSRSLLSIASPYFCDLLASQEETMDETLTKVRLQTPPAFEWEIDECTSVVEVDETSTVLDPLLRFLYPVPEPVFKEPVSGQSVNELPYRLMGPIYDMAKRYQFSYVCQRILDIAHDIIYIKSLPEPGLSALRAYGIACRLNLNYDLKLKAARNTLCVPYTTSPTDGLEEEGITSADIQRYANFHKRAVQACQDLLQLSEFDLCPIGLSDVYATFVACPRCCGIQPNGNVMRCGAARWWQVYSTYALERLRLAPLDPSIFSENFLTPVFRKAQSCHACSNVVHWKWCNMMPMLAQTIPAKVYEVGLMDGEDYINEADNGDVDDETEQCDRTQ